MPFSWNEINNRAEDFVKKWQDRAPNAKEKSDAQTFENDFFHIFGVTRSEIAIFEHRVQLANGAKGYIDLFWKGHILIEMKSPGENMLTAYEQAKRYASALQPSDLPKGILICDFNKFHYYNLLEDAKLYQFNLDKLVDNVKLFDHIAGYKDVIYLKQEEVNKEAAEKMGKLHNRLKQIGYNGHKLELYLVRLLFCMFADDTGIFEHNTFVQYLNQRTSIDGSDLALHLQSIFEILNVPKQNRLAILDHQLNEFPYINGGLFSERLEIAAFDSSMRNLLIECCGFNWREISPAIFGSMFQSVMNPQEQRDLGAHYTSEENILKVIRPLFLDSLWNEFDKYRSYISDAKIENLKRFHDKLGKMKFFDPACGCGNFLIVTYREIRILELSIIKEILGDARILDINLYVKVNVDQFYGIEIEEFPSQIAQVAMWLIDHQMNLMAKKMFGQYFVRIPLTVCASITCGNSLELDWESIIPKNELSFILGNPPFLGKKEQSDTQKAELLRTFGTLKNASKLDYVSAWFRKAVEYIQNTNIEVGFVSTNSICQGEQVAILWPELLNKYNIKINFAHQTFKWSNEARGIAAVHCIIIGFSLFDRKNKQLFLYENIKGGFKEVSAKQINAYLIDAAMVFINSLSKPLQTQTPNILFGSMPNDGKGRNFLFNDQEKNDFLQTEPNAECFVKPFMSAREFLNSEKRWCLWLKNANPTVLRGLNDVMRRVNNVRSYRLRSTRTATRLLAENPTLFGEDRQPEGKYLLIPRHSSEQRKYIPLAFFDSNTIVGDSCLFIENAKLYHFGILMSQMHMAWVKYVCGRIKSDYRYSNTIVYNNYPWPINPTEKQEKCIEEKAQAVLNIRAQFSDSSLADLYDPLTMPQDLQIAHNKLDKAVEDAYNIKFDSDEQRVAFLFEMYQQLTKPKKSTKPKAKLKQPIENIVN